jgi:hypothetical protein
MMSMMRASADTWTVVVAGQWNRHIFTPQWVGKHLFESPTVQIETQIAPVAGGSIRYLTDDVVLLPQADRLIVGVRRIDDDALRRVEQIACKALALLPYTPVTALGMNFGFTSPSIPDSLQPVFHLADQGSLSDLNVTVRRTEVKRTLVVEDRDDEVVNLTLSIDHDQGRFSIHVNFHSQVQEASTAKSRLDGVLVAHKTRCLDLLRGAYGITADEEEVPDDELARAEAP